MAKQKIKKIVFVCTGNTCRSPMAEAAFSAEIKRKSLPAVATSAGLNVSPTERDMNEKAAKTLLHFAYERNAPIGGYRSLHDARAKRTFKTREKAFSGRGGKTVGEKQRFLFCGSHGRGYSRSVRKRRKDVCGNAGKNHRGVSRHRRKVVYEEASGGKIRRKNFGKEADEKSGNGRKEEIGEENFEGRRER